MRKSSSPPQHRIWYWVLGCLAIGVTLWGAANAGSPPPAPSIARKRPTPRARPLVKQWVAMLQHRDLLQRKKAMEALHKLGPQATPAWPALHRALKDPDWSIRQRAALLMSQTGLQWQGQSSLTALTECTKDQHEKVRAAAFWALGLAAREDFPMLLSFIKEGLRDTNWLVRERAAEWFGRVGHVPTALQDSLRRVLKDRSWQVRTAAAWSFAHAPNASNASLQSLAALLQDPEPSVRYMVVRALQTFGARTFSAIAPFLRATQPLTRKHALHVLAPFADLSTQTQMAYIATLRDLDPAIREASALALGALGPRAAFATDALIALFQEQQASLRSAAIWALSRIGAHTVKSLSQTLHDKRWRVKTAAARSLSAMGSQSASATPFLVDALLDKEWRVRREAAWALFRIGPKVRQHLPLSMLPILLNALQDKLWKIRFAVIKTLAQFGPQGSIVVGWFGPQAVSTVGVLKKLQGDPDPRVRQAAKEALQLILKPLSKSR